ncbi:transporter substrate-binding domain-containing protein [Legionella maioricensis]|uniref:Transporter substrate-binding domain-containing protein n=1 Tax=Legionella maioricensis TaxID=2896528 RepID=A0A9X2D040_9GAMM|nr:transporter substrate-binding domain-containing protein [Legionella maioricensis]MCL9683941.1 transporter substrate-binding domain-containing protein [Legionella maioricensis]MCL9688293.1 transporter substrate-binding domain-containing protein [Legionella maioricensis]
MNIKILLLAFCFLFSTSGYSDIKIGTLIFNPPFILSLGAGFDMDLTRLLCKRLNEQCHFIPMTIDQLSNALHNGEIDMAIGGISISPTQKTDYIFSLPYMLSKGQFLVLSDGPYQSLNKLQGSTVGVVQDDLNGGVFYNYLQTTYHGLFKIQQYANVSDILSALNSKVISAAFLHRSVVNYWTQQDGSNLPPLGPIVLLGDGIAFMASPKNKELIDRINVLLKQMEQDNTYLNLYNTYFANE